MLLTKMVVSSLLTKMVVNPRIRDNRRGWVVWAWSKAGALLVFAAMMLMLMAAYSFASASEQSDEANGIARALRNSISDTYNSIGGMSFEHELPQAINGQAYSMEVLNKSGGTIGIIVRVRSGIWEVLGGSSMSVSLSDGSFGTLKGFGDGLSHLCIVKGGSVIFIERSRC